MAHKTLELDTETTAAHYAQSMQKLLGVAYVPKPGDGTLDMSTIRGAGLPIGKINRLYGVVNRPGVPNKNGRVYAPSDVRATYKMYQAYNYMPSDPGTIDMLDLDVEGCEWYILQAMISRPKIICTETGVGRNHPFMEEIDAWALENRYVEFRHYDSNSWFKRLP